MGVSTRGVFYTLDITRGDFARGDFTRGKSTRGIHSWGFFLLVGIFTRWGIFNGGAFFFFSLSFAYFIL